MLANTPNSLSALGSLNAGLHSPAPFLHELLNFIKEEVNKSKQLFNKYKWPIIDVTRRSVEETAASILKIFEINKNK